MEYGMFSKEGNAAVHQIVMQAAMHKQSDVQVMKALELLSTIEDFGEATDTAVRESVGFALGWY